MSTLNPVVEAVVNQLKKYAPEKIILFGSYAYGDPGEESDIDLVLIKKTNDSFHERQKQVRMLLRSTTPVDIFVFTPEEFLKAQSSNLFIREVAQKGRLLYG